MSDPLVEPQAGKSCCSMNVLTQYIISDFDTRVARERKEVVFTFAACANITIPLGILTAISRAGAWDRGRLFLVSAFIAFLLNLGSLMYILLTKSFRNSLMVLYIAGLFLCIVINDVHASSAGHQRMSVLVIVILDMAIVGHTPPRAADAIAALACLWVIVASVEDANRLGFWDVWGTAPVDVRSENCACITLPCAEDAKTAFMEVLLESSGILLSYFFVRRFAKVVTDEHRNMTVAIQSANDIACALVKFDLAEARAAIEAHKDILPLELYASFEKLLFNLDMYYPYLPQSCLPNSGQLVDGMLVQPRSPSLSSTASSASRELSLSTARPALAPPANLNLRTNHIRHARISLLSIIVHIPQLPSTHFLEFYAATHEAFVALALTRVAKCRGVVDTFIANRIIASFNAARPAACHAAMAVKTVNGFVASLPGTAELENVEMSGAISSGDAVVGVLGAEAMRRPAILGIVPVMLQQMERVCALGGPRWLCGARTYAEAHFEIPMRVLLDVIIDKRVGGEAGSLDVSEDTDKFDTWDSQGLDTSPPPTVVLYELCVFDTSAGAADEVSAASEWMYGGRQASRNSRMWARYNEAGNLFHGQTYGAALRHLADEAPDIVARFKRAAAAARQITLHPVVAPVELNEESV